MFIAFYGSEPGSLTQRGVRLARRRSMRRSTRQHAVNYDEMRNDDEGERRRIFSMENGFGLAWMARRRVMSWWADEGCILSTDQWWVLFEFSSKISWLDQQTTRASSDNLPNQSQTRTTPWAPLTTIRSVVGFPNSSITLNLSSHRSLNPTKPPNFEFLIQSQVHLRTFAKSPPTVVSLLTPEMRQKTRKQNRKKSSSRDGRQIKTKLLLSVEWGVAFNGDSRHNQPPLFSFS